MSDKGGARSPLFYEKVAPLDRVIHRELRLDRGKDAYKFASAVNLLPAVIDEFGAAMAHLPIAFLPGARRPAAVFVVGINPGRNLFLDEGGRWSGQYVPAYLRRYPFIVGDVPGGDPLLCIDESHRGLVKTSGEPLFDEAGEPTHLVRQALELAVNYKHSADRTDEFGAMLQELGVLSSVSLSAQPPGGETTVVHGLMAVDEAAFDALDAEAVSKLHEKRFLKPIMQHMASLAAVAKLAERNLTGKPAETQEARRPARQAKPKSTAKH